MAKFNILLHGCVCTAGSRWGGGRCIVGLPQITSKCNPFRSLDQYPLPCRRVVSLALQVEVVFGFCG